MNNDCSWQIVKGGSYKFSQFENWTTLSSFQKMITTQIEYVLIVCELHYKQRIEHFMINIWFRDTQVHNLISKKRLWMEEGKIIGHSMNSEYFN